jgi:hypothetical protein
VAASQALKWSVNILAVNGLEVENSTVTKGHKTSTRRLLHTSSVLTGVTRKREGQQQKWKASPYYK